MSILNETGAKDLGLSSVKDNDELGVLRSIDFLTERGTEYMKTRDSSQMQKKVVISVRYIGNAVCSSKDGIRSFLVSFFLWEKWLRLQEKRKCKILVSVSFTPSVQSEGRRLGRRWRQQSGLQSHTWRK